MANIQEISQSQFEVVIIHGGWHKPVSYAKLTAGLEKNGFKVHIPPLPTMSGKRPPVADLYTDSDFIRDYITKLSDDGVKSIVLMHSYGGQVGTNALIGLGAAKRADEGKKGGVVQLVYMAGLAMVEGTSMTEWVDSQGHSELMPFAFDFQDDGIVMSRDPKTLVVGADLLSEEDMDQYLATFTTWASKSWADPLKNSAWREIPVTYIETTKDMTILHDYQTQWIEAMRAAGSQVSTTVLDTGHCPNVTATDDVVNVVIKIAAKLTG